MSRYDFWTTYWPAAIFAFILSGVYEMALGDATYTNVQFWFWVVVLLWPFGAEIAFSWRS